jgi:hypothetical protein
VTSLRETQQLMWTLIAAPEGVADGLRQIDKKPADLERVLRGDERLSAVQRLDIYANMYFFRLYEVLQKDYPVLRGCVGDESFYRLCTAYLAACPSQHPSVRNVGERLARFLPGHALGIEHPWLAELAELERARLEVFDGPDAEPLTLDELRARPPESFVALPLPLIPSRRLVVATHAIDEVWSAVDGAEEGQGPPPPPAPEPRMLLVWRQGVDVYHRPLAPLETEALTRAAAGATFGQVCDLIAERVPLEEAGATAFALLSAWVQDGLIAR